MNAALRISYAMMYGKLCHWRKRFAELGIPSTNYERLYRAYNERDTPLGSNS